MKKYLTLIIMSLPLMCSAETVNDTTFTYNDKKIVVTDSEGSMNVTVEDQQGETFRKLSETTFVNGQEVTQVYVTSPFLPSKWNPRRRRSFSSHIPWFSYGMSMLSGSPMSFGSDDGMQQQSSKSWEFCFAPLSVAIPFNRLHTFGMSVGIQTVWIKHHFNRGHTLCKNDGTVSVQPIELADGEHVKKSYISYKAIRVPVNLEYQHNIGHHDFFATIGASLEWRLEEHSRYKTNRNTITPTKDININPIGVNLEAQVGYADFSLFMRTALTPLMKTNSAPEVYPTTVGLAFGF